MNKDRTEHTLINANDDIQIIGEALKRISKRAENGPLTGLVHRHEAHRTATRNIVLDEIVETTGANWKRRS